jgi:GT2 family glycosyltransferase/SAM-dependent methyltransferase/glycosyltransferase involved in cell wall biosynthesis
MEFTGERYLPSEAGQIRHEHMHRYAWCRSLVSGKVVLDIACGEGYGSAMLATHASQVIGVDISSEAVDHAARTYEKHENLKYLQGNAAAIPLPGTSVDVVVSFETIEHHDRHEEMIREIRRVLRPEGILVMSSPNRVVYSERAGYHNEFHVKELDFQEFDALLRKHFGNIRYYGQRLAVGSALFDLAPGQEDAEVTAFTDTGTTIEERTTRLIDPVYFLAVAKAEHSDLPSTSSSVLFSENEDLYNHHLEVATWAQRLSSEHTVALGHIESLVADKKALVANTQALMADKQALEQEMAVAESDLLEMRAELAKRNARIYTLERVREELEQLKASRSWRWTRPLRFALRTLRHRGLSPEDRRRLGWLPQPTRGIASSGMPPANFTTVSTHGQAQTTENIHRGAPDALLAPQSPGKRDFFVWAVIDWHFRIQRPQHLARELATAGHRVFYVSNHFIDRAESGFSVEALDAEGRLFQVHLHLAGSPAIYQAAPNGVQREQLRAGIGELLAWTRSRTCASLVQHPYWLEAAQLLPNQRMVYDCMDHHGGFADNTQDVLMREHELMRNADLLVVTSDWLQAETGKYNPRSLMVRNACQYEHFCEPPAEVFRDPRGRRVIGYYGAIAEWFDLDLLEKVARRHPDCLVLLVGGDTGGAHQRLRHLDNVEFIGEVAYTKLPYYLYAFDVCLLPFQVIPLTLATNPVKVYEYLSAGKPVVSIDLPEIRQFGDLVSSGADHDAFLAALEATLSAPADPQEIARRKAFAAEQTWAHRVHDLVRGVEALPQPRVSVVVVTYNNLDLTKVCLESVDRYSDYPNLELIVVDNASADETAAYLQAWQRAGSHRHIILNAENRGFAAANNQGLAAATGEYLVMLNNDTHVTPGWIGTLVGHMRRSEALGMLGPVTNNIGNEARIDIRYADMEQMLRVSGDYTARHAGQLTPLHTAAFFCAMMPRHVYEKVGELDEAFGIGMFEDDDYCRRVQKEGWQVACAEDVFVHHHLSASFSQIKQEKRQAMFEANKVIYEAKWGTWMPHKYRNKP